MTAAQMNVRMDSSLKQSGDFAWKQAGFTPAHAVRALWGYAVRNSSDRQKLRNLVRVLETDAGDLAAPETRDDSTGAKDGSRDLSALDGVYRKQAELYAKLGLKPLVIQTAKPGSDKDYENALQRQVDYDKAALEEIYAEREEEWGI